MAASVTRIANDVITDFIATVEALAQEALPDQEDAVKSVMALLSVGKLVYLTQLGFAELSDALASFGDGNEKNV